MFEKYGMDDLRACFNITCCVLGIGSLSMSRAFAQAGPFPASVALLIMCVINIYSTVVLSKCMKAAPIYVQTFSDLGEYVSGTAGRYAVIGSQIGNCLMVPIAFLVLGGSQLLPAIFKGVVDLTPNAWIPLMALSLLPVVLIRTLKEGAWVALIGAAGAFFGDFFAVVDSLTFAPVPEMDTQTKIDTINVFKVFGSMSLAYGAAVVIPSIQRDHSKPENMPFAITSSLLLITVCYALIGALGYFHYGCESPANLLSAMNNHTLEVLAMVFFFFHIAIGFAVLLNPALFLFERNLLGFYKVHYESMVDDDYTTIDLAEEKMKKQHHSVGERKSFNSRYERDRHSFNSGVLTQDDDRGMYLKGKQTLGAVSGGGELDLVEESAYVAPFTWRMRLKSYSLRTTVVIIQVFIAMILQSVFDDLADFCGATCITVACMVLPVYFYFQMFKERLHMAEKVWCWFIIVASIVFGGYTAYLYLHQMIDSVSSIQLFTKAPSRAETDPRQYCF